jgi:hypothetical protein
MAASVLVNESEAVETVMIGKAERTLVGDDCSPEEKQQILNAFARMLDADAIHARSKGDFDRANCFAEVAHQLRRGNVVESGELRMLDSLK